MPAASLRALLENAIDYAGLFPPAGLALDPALRNQAGYVRSPDRWMLGAFVLPIGKFAAARNHLAEFEPEHPLRISALGPKTAKAADFRPKLETAAEAIKQFIAEHKGVVAIEQFEMPLPAGPVADSLGVARATLGDLALNVFWEAPADAAPATIEALAGSGAGFKLRTGGVTADAFPSGGANLAGARRGGETPSANQVYGRPASSGSAFSRERRRQDARLPQRPRGRRARSRASLERNADAGNAGG